MTSPMTAKLCPTCAARGCRAVVDPTWNFCPTCGHDLRPGERDWEWVIRNNTWRNKPDPNGEKP